MTGKTIKNELPSHYHLAGIATSLKEYKVCFHLNQLLHCDFKKLDVLVFEPKDRTRKVQFSVFKAVTGDENTNFVLFGNKNMGEYLLPEVNQFDYVLQVNGKLDEIGLKELIEGIKLFPEVMMCAEIPLKKIKSRERLVYEEIKPAAERFKGARKA